MLSAHVLHRQSGTMEWGVCFEASCSRDFVGHPAGSDGIAGAESGHSRKFRRAQPMSIEAKKFRSLSRRCVLSLSHAGDSENWVSQRLSLAMCAENSVRSKSNCCRDQTHSTIMRVYLEVNGRYRRSFLQTRV